MNKATSTYICKNLNKIITKEDKEIKLKSKATMLSVKKKSRRTFSPIGNVNNVRHNDSMEIKKLEADRNTFKYSPHLRKNEISQLNINTKSTNGTGSNSHNSEICQLEGNKKKLNKKNQHTNKLGVRQKHSLKKMAVAKANSFTNLTIKCQHNVKKANSKTAVSRKKMLIKNSKLSVIPEIKIEPAERKSSSTIYFPHTTTNSSTCATKFKSQQSRPEIKISDCKTFYNNNSFGKYTNTYRNSGSSYKSNRTNFDKRKYVKEKEPIPIIEYTSNSETMIKIRLFEKKSRNNVTYQKIEFVSSLNLLTISSKTYVSRKSNKKIYGHCKNPINEINKMFSKTERGLRSSLTGSSYKASSFNNIAFSNSKTHKYHPCKYISGDLWPRTLQCVGDSSSLVPSNLQKVLHELGSREHHTNLSNYKCHMKLKSHKCKFPSRKMTMSEGDGLPDQIYSRVSNWISSHDFQVRDHGKTDTEAETVISNDIPSDITSVTRTMAKKKGEYDDIIIEERTDVVKCRECESPVSSERNFSERVKILSNNKSVRTLSKFSQYSPFQSSGNLKSASAPPTQFSVIVEGEESELPESNKRSELSFKSIKTSNFQPVVPTQPSRPSSRHKRHADAMIPSKAPSIDRKTRKRRTLEKIGASVEERQKMLEEIVSNRAERQNRRRQQRKLQTEQFVKSMQMLQANARDPEPFEDYSIFLYRQTAPKFEDRVKDLEKQFTYVPDHENKMPNLTSRAAGADEDLAARIKSFEDKLHDSQPVDKKPKDLLRAIGKIETSDWNIKEIEKKIRENKMGKPSKVYDKEKVPKWSKEQFLARQTKMEKQHLDRQDSAEAKFADIDKSIKHLDQKLKEGTIRELGQNKVATITEKLVSKVPQEPKLVEKTNTRPMVLPSQGGSEFCHFCGKRVYLMERLSAEGRFFHHGCFKCQYCNTQLRLGSYAFDRDGLYDYKFFCLHHFGMVGELHPTAKVTRKPSQRQPRQSPEKKPAYSGVDLLDRVQTPERAEFANLSTSNVSSDQEESISQMDEDEWTDKNFGASCAEMDDSEDDSSSLSDTDSEDEDAFDDALEEPITKEGTMKWADRWKNSYSRKRRDSDSNGYSSSDQSSYYENSSDDDDSDTATEGEEEIRARELRKQEVRVEPPIVQTDTGTDTEVVSDETSSESSSEIQNSATEISTDSEFAHDDPTPTREIPAIVLNDFNVTKTRGSGGITAKKIQVTSGYLQRPTNGRSKKPNIELKLKPLVPSAPTIKKPAQVLLPRTEGYALNRTQSTGGIAAKVSLELKKKYLLGESAASAIQKSGSASTLDSKFKTFHTNISDCQKLLKPAKEISASMQTFCNKLNERQSPILSPVSPTSNHENDEKYLLTKEKEPPPDISNVISNNASDNKVPESEPFIFKNEPEGRPRSPVHETSIIVPEIDWNKRNESQSSDSLCMSSSDNEIEIKSIHQFENIPRVEVYEVNDDDDDIPPDSLCIVETNIEKHTHTDNSEPSKSITSEKKTLNQPKSLPNLENILPDIHKSLHVNLAKVEKNVSPEIDTTSVKNSSGLSSPDSGAEQVTTALTETELSDWARDGVVSDDFEDVEFEFNREFEKPLKKDKEIDTPLRIAEIPEFDDRVNHVCGKGKQIKDLANKTIITEAMNDILSANLDNIEFMDTGTETSSDDGVGNSQDGYVLFKNEDDFAEDSLNPNINEIVEATNIHIDEKYEPKNTGYCILATEDKHPEVVAHLKSSDLEKPLPKPPPNEHEEDSLLILETGTTTEENTCSDSTVKNITELSVDKSKLFQDEYKESNLHKQKLEEKLAKVKEELILKQQNAKEKESSQKETIRDNSIEFEEHCHRLQSKVEFGNVKDSIDVRKSRRKSKSDSPQKPDLIQEEKSSLLHSPKLFPLNLASAQKTPDILYKKEILQKERDVNQKLIQEMVMNKMKAENKSLERKKRNKQTSPCVTSTSPYSLNKSATTDVSQLNLNNSNRSSLYSTGSSTYATPDVLLSTNLIPLQNSKSHNTVYDISSGDVFSTPLSSIKEQSMRPVSVHSCIMDGKISEKKTSQSFNNSENCSVPDIRKNLFSNNDFVTPKAPPRLHRLNDEANKTKEKLKQDARARAKLLSNEDLGLSPEEKLSKLKEKINKRGKENEVLNSNIQEGIKSTLTERRNPCLYSNDALTKNKNNAFRRSMSGEYAAEQTCNSKVLVYRSNACYDSETPVRTKSVSDFPNNFSISESTAQNETKKFCKSDPNLLDTEYVKPKKKSKDRERRKSITKLISTFFAKKSPSNGNSRSLFAKLSPKSKDLSKVVVNEEPVRRRSLSEIERITITPPPIPPLPLNYTVKDESSEGEFDCKKQGRSSCDTLDKSGIVENSTSSLTGRKASKSARKVARQAQLKRHRMAQEIQRKLEETEVKTRELETRGVVVEKALRGEDNGQCLRDESELLQEWFDLMRDRTELRRYEKELMIRAQELELEDRHARLQHELRDRLENNEQKTGEDVKIEESIINEMMEIVSKRDSLIAAIEEDRLRYSNEDRDLEEQMLAKGLRLTPIRKTPE